MTDLRDELFRDVHTQWLKPAGFRKLGRHSRKQLDNGLVLSVVLESGQSEPLGALRFDLEVRATHLSLPPNKVLINIGLCARSSGAQRWVAQPHDDSAGTVSEHVRRAFELHGVPLLARMRTVEDLAALFAELDSVWYYKSYAWCLDRLGQVEQATRVIECAIERAPHEGFKSHARRLLQERLVLRQA